MFHMSTGGRRAMAATAFAVLLTTAACGTNTGEVDEAVPAAPAQVQPAPFYGSADAAEAQGLLEEMQQEAQASPPDPRVPDYMP
jgi:hypothetical protein